MVALGLWTGSGRLFQVHRPAMAKARGQLYVLSQWHVCEIGFAWGNEDFSGWTAGHSERRGTKVPDRSGSDWLWPPAWTLQLIAKSWTQCGSTTLWSATALSPLKWTEVLPPKRLNRHTAFNCKYQSTCLSAQRWTFRHRNFRQCSRPISPFSWADNKTRRFCLKPFLQSNEEHHSLRD